MLNSGCRPGEVQYGLSPRHAAQGSARQCYQLVFPGISCSTFSTWLLTPRLPSTAEPDWSNPTRPRFERPLDTIKSFEVAINSTYNNNRHSYAKTGPSG